MNWLILTKDNRQELLKQLCFKTGIQPQAIEKDAWVTLVLRVVFNSEIAEHLVFKGGTSLSKAYGLIKRFSEDIDIAINREYLGFTGELTKGQIRKLRRESHLFVLNEMSNIIAEEFERHNIDNHLFEIEVENTKISDQDPEIIKITYQSVFDELSYIPRRVLIEIGARSLIEPSEGKEIRSIIDENFFKSSFAESSFIVKTVLPEKTFLEKMILLHEEFTKPKENIRYHRMSRHLYDIGQIISTEFGERALKNESLFKEIIKHRAKYTPIKTVDYSKLELNNLRIIPSDEFLELYEKDYFEMQENMIYGEKISFNKLINKILSKTPSR